MGGFIDLTFTCLMPSRSTHHAIANKEFCFKFFFIYLFLIIILQIFGLSPNLEEISLL